MRRYERAPEMEPESSIPVGERYGYLNLKLPQELRDEGFTLQDNNDGIITGKQRRGKI